MSKKRIEFELSLALLKNNQILMKMPNVSWSRLIWLVYKWEFGEVQELAEVSLFCYGLLRQNKSNSKKLIWQKEKVDENLKAKSLGWWFASAYDFR